MRAFTLDTNCIVALDEGRPESRAVRALADAHAARTADVAVVGIAASENQRPGANIGNFREFQERLERLGLGHLNVLMPMAYADVCFFDWCVAADDAMVEFERQIHTALFPNIEFAWADYCQSRGLDPSQLANDSKWRNAKCDVQTLWAHLHHKRDVFVTSDRNFHRRRAALLTLGLDFVSHPPDSIFLIDDANGRA